MALLSLMNRRWGSSLHLEKVAVGRSGRCFGDGIRATDGLRTFGSDAFQLCLLLACCAS